MLEILSKGQVSRQPSKGGSGSSRNGAVIRVAVDILAPGGKGRKQRLIGQSFSSASLLEALSSVEQQTNTAITGLIPEPRLIPKNPEQAKALEGWCSELCCAFLFCCCVDDFPFDP